MQAKYPYQWYISRLHAEHSLFLGWTPSGHDSERSGFDENCYFSTLFGSHFTILSLKCCISIHNWDQPAILFLYNPQIKKKSKHFLSPHEIAMATFLLILCSGVVSVSWGSESAVGLADSHSLWKRPVRPGWRYLTLQLVYCVSSPLTIHSNCQLDQINN